MRILGIDPGFERLGVAILEKNKGDKKEKVLFSECFKTSANLEFSERLLLIGTEVKRVIKEYQPEVLSIETLFLTTNHKTVMHVAEARGVVIYEASSANLKIFEASPPQIKIATTGYGKANKDQVMKMVKILVDIEPKKSSRVSKDGITCSKSDFGKSHDPAGSDDELDAVAIALTAFAHLR